MVGPPMSIFSIFSSIVELVFLATSEKGYRLQTTRSIQVMLFFFASALSLSLCPRIPPEIYGLRVLTLPPKISGKREIEDTFDTFIPASFKDEAVPPVANIFTPFF